MKKHRSEAEYLFDFQMRSSKLPKFVIEHQFHPERKWRFDFAFPDQKIAVEIEGGIFSQGRHSRGIGFRKDCEKYNHASLLSWRVFRFDTDQVKDGSAVEFMRKVLKRGTS